MSSTISGSAGPLPRRGAPRQRNGFGPVPPRPVVLAFASYYLPGYRAGGPIRTLQNLIHNLGDEFDFRVVTRDRDLNGPGPYEGVRRNAWNSVEGAHVYYCSPRELSLYRLVRLLRRTAHDLIYFNSLFDPALTVRPLLLRRLGIAPPTPVVLAPRGELSPGALSIKHRKKTVYLYASARLGLYKGAYWQASSAHEAACIREKKLGADRIAIAPNPSSPKAPGADFAPRASGSPPRVVFLSRISPMKNLDFALRVLSQVRTPLHFDIFGPIEDKAYWGRCRSQMDALPEQAKVRYRGEVRPEDVTRVLGGYDLLFLPTKGENYGHVIIEALGAGVPVLTSDLTPWRDLEAASAGWDLPLTDVDAFRKRLERVALLDSAEVMKMRKSARSYAARHADMGAALEAWRRLIHSALQGGATGRVSR